MKELKILVNSNAQNLHRKSINNQIAASIQFWNYTVNDGEVIEKSEPFVLSDTVIWLLEAKYISETIETLVYDFANPGTSQTNIYNELKAELLAGGLENSDINRATYEPAYDQLVNPGPGNENVQEMSTLVTNRIFPDLTSFTVRITLTVNVKGS